MVAGPLPRGGGRGASWQERPKRRCGARRWLRPRTRWTPCRRAPGAPLAWEAPPPPGALPLPAPPGPSKPKTLLRLPLAPQVQAHEQTALPSPEPGPCTRDGGPRSAASHLQQGIGRCCALHLAHPCSGTAPARGDAPPSYACDRAQALHTGRASHAAQESTWRELLPRTTDG